MKASVAQTGKRRWRGPSMVVPALVLLSLLVPLAFLLGLHNRFPTAGFSADDRRETESSFGSYGRVDHEDSRFSEEAIRMIRRQIDEDISKHIGTKVSANLIEFTAPPKGAAPKHHKENPVTETEDVSSHSGSSQQSSKYLPSPRVSAALPPPALTSRKAGGLSNKDSAMGSALDESGKSCQLEFGSYCLWSVEHKEVMRDSMVKRIKDQLFVARAYYPSIAKLQQQEKLTRELKQNIQEHERMLSEAVTDSDLPLNVQKNIEKMDQIIARAKACPVDCNNVDKKLRQILDLTEDETHFHMKQSAFLYQLGVQTMQKSLHCLSMRLTLEHFQSASIAQNLDISRSKHLVIFSKNILALSVVINSTVMSCEETGDMAIHVITDAENYYAMKVFFYRNSFKDTIIDILNFDDFMHINYSNLGLPHFSLSEEFRISYRGSGQGPPMQMRTEYIPVFGHSHFLLPEIFKNLKKVVVLDDDVVVQRDLSPLWNLDLQGKVNGAAEFCKVRMGQLKSFIGRSNYDHNSCLWTSGLNVVDLEKWREHNINKIYHEALQKLQTNSEAAWRAAALPGSLLAFQNLIYPLHDSWVLSGLGYNYRLDENNIKDAAVLHFNGNMKPWLDLGIPRYKKFWKKFLTKEEPFMDECNVNP